MTLLHLDNICAGYGRQQILHDVTVEIGKGELIVLAGANASGKTTLVRVLAELKRPHAGTISWSDASQKNARPSIGLAVAPEALPSGLTGFHAIELVKAALQTTATETALDYAHAIGLCAHLNQSISRYSAGTKQKLAITLALIGDAPLLLLDESLNGLDLLSVGRTLEYLKTRICATGKSVLLVTHHLDLAQPYSKRIWLLTHGKLVYEWTSCELAQMQEDGVLISRKILDYLQASSATTR